MKIISVFAVIFLAVSCKDDSVALFESELFLNWHTTYEIKVLGNEYLNNYKYIDRPYNTWMPLFEAKMVDELAIKSKRQCLIYRIPFNQLQGVLKLVEVDNSEKCEDAFDKKEIGQLDSIDGLKIFYSKSEILDHEQKKVLRPFSVNILIDHKGDQRWISIPLLNIMDKRKMTLYSSGEKTSYNKGVLFWPYSTTEVDLSNRKGSKKYLGTMNDRYADGTLVNCENLTDNCSLNGSSRCDRCRYGWFEVVGSKCKNRRTKYCGPDHCGEKGEPACIRGDISQGISRELGCFGGSKAGFCKPNLATYCDGNGILICL